MGLFSDIYNTVAKFFRPQEEQGDASKSVATNRLKLVLMQDRTNLTPKILEQMRGELIDLLSRYVALMLSIPVIRAKEEEEIEAALKAEAEKLEEKAEEISAKSEDEESTEEDSEEEAQQDTDDESETKSQAVSTPEEMNSSEKEENSEEGIEAK